MYRNFYIGTYLLFKQLRLYFQYLIETWNNFARFDSLNQYSAIRIVIQNSNWIWSKANISNQTAASMISSSNGYSR